jgi:hypothetical protein
MLSKRNFIGPEQVVAEMGNSCKIVAEMGNWKFIALKAFLSLYCAYSSEIYLIEL